jgi:hypothetical protein
MQHWQRAGGKKCVEVDHFRPKGKNRNHYSNLFPATRHCNGAKGQTWPTAADQRDGIRFLNPCKEADYGTQIFEDANTHELVGVNAAARFHIICCDLNAEHLIAERRDRAQIRKALSQTPATITGSLKGFAESLLALRKQLELMIPEIPTLPI